MVDESRMERWTPKCSTLEPLLVEPGRRDDAGRIVEYRCVKAESGAAITIDRKVLEAYYKRDGHNGQEAA